MLLAVLGLGVAMEPVNVLPAADGLNVAPASTPVPPTDGLNVVAPASASDGICVSPELATDEDGLEAPLVLISDGLDVVTSSVASTGEIVGH